MPLLSRSQSQPSIVNPEFGSLDAEPSRWTVTGAIELAGVAVALAVGEVR